MSPIHPPKDIGSAVPEGFRLPWNTTRTMADVWPFSEALEERAPPEAPPKARTVLWTQEKVVVLEGMWAAGWTARAIASALGDKFTKSSVLGKVHRMNLPVRRHIRPHGAWNAETLRYAGREG